MSKNKPPRTPVYLAFRRAPTVGGEAYCANGRSVHALLKSLKDGMYPMLYAECLCEGSAKALNEYNDFMEQLCERSPARAISLHSQVLDEMTKIGGDPAPLKQVAQLLQKKGRGGDTVLAHITPDEARHLKDHGGSPDLIRSIVHLETTQGYYDKITAPFDGNTSILPMNIKTEVWSELGYTRDELKNPVKNIEAGVEIVKKLTGKMPNATVEQIGTLYNSLGSTVVSNYGKRIGKLYREKPWQESN